MQRSEPVRVLSRWPEVSAALAHPDLVIAPGVPAESPVPYDQRQLNAWVPFMTSSAAALAASLPLGVVVDLMSAYAAPWARQVAMLVLGLDAPRLQEMLPHAEALFRASAHAESGDSGTAVAGPAAELARLLPAQPLAVQSLVALVHTLPHALCGAWAVLLHQPEEQARLRNNAGLLPGAIEELLRLAGPSRAVYRVAVKDVTIGGERIPAGSTVRLELGQANRDPARFHDPDRYHPARVEGLHLAFGRGRHACAGAQLIRQAAGIATAALLARGTLEEAGEPAWLDGAAIRAPATLPVILSPPASDNP